MVSNIGVRDPIPGVVYPDSARLNKYVQDGVLPTYSLVSALMESFAINADKTAIVTEDRSFSYAEIDDISDRFAGALIKLGLRPLDRVLFQSANSAQLVFSVLGCLKAGLIPVCTLPGHRSAEISYIGTHVEARAHIVQGDDEKFDLVEFATSMREQIATMEYVIAIGGQPVAGSLRFDDLLANQDRDEALSLLRRVTHDPYQVAVFQLSGGTSGVPKVIPRMQNEYLLNITLGIKNLGFANNDVMFMPMPMMHNASMVCMWLPTLVCGATFTIPSNMTPLAWAKIFKKSTPTIVGFIRALLPRYDEMIDSFNVDVSAVRMYWTPDAAKIVREKYNRPAIAMFGMSEGMFMYPPLNAPEQVMDWTVGVPMSEFDEVRLVRDGGRSDVGIDEVGELECRGPYTISGYYKAEQRNSEAFTEDGFYKTGDLMIRKQIEGKLYYTFAGRTKDIVDRGHEKVNCEEIENAVSSHRSVLGCAVVGMPDPVLGERICAYIVPKSGTDMPSVKLLANHLETLGLAKFKWPERVELIDELPLTKVGKLDKAVLREDIRMKINSELVASS